MERYADACVLEVQRAFGGSRPRRRRPPSSSEGAPRPASTPTPCAASSTPSRARPAPRSPSSAIPRTPTRRTSTPTGAPASPASPSACSRRTPTCWPASGRRHVPARRRDHLRRRGRRRLRHLEPRPHLRRPRRERRRLGRHARRTSSPSSTRRRTSSAYGLTVEPGTPLARDPARHPDEDALARRYERADAVLAAAGYRWEEISNWARPGPRVPAQPPLLGAGRLRRHRLGRPLAPRRRALVERAHARALRRRHRGRALARGRPRGADRRPARVRGAAAVAAHPARRAVGRASSGPRSSRVSSTATAIGPCSRVRGRLLANEVSARIRSGILHR